MDTKAYIASGQLEAYALSLLPPEEAAQVAAAVAQHPELAEELARIETDLQHIAEAGAVPPPAGMEDQIWNRIQKEESSAIPLSTPSTGSAPPTHLSATSPLRPTWARAAVWAALVGSLALNAYFWYENSDRNKALEQNQQELAQLRQQQQDLQQQIAQFRQSSQTIFSAGSQMIPLQSLHGEQTYILVYNADRQLALFDMSKMPPPPEGRQYQMWAIVNGQPQSMGVIPIQKPKNGMLEMQQPAQPGQEAFAISLEKEGGNPTPTEVLMLGKVKG